MSTSEDSRGESCGLGLCPDTNWRGCCPPPPTHDSPQCDLGRLQPYKCILSAVTDEEQRVETTVLAVIAERRPVHHPSFFSDVLL